MNKIQYTRRCKCKEKKKDKTLGIKKKLGTKRKLISYPEPYEIESKTFRIQYHQNLSLKAKSVLNSFNKKYLYHAIDDVLEVFRSNSTEKKKLLTILYSPVLSLQNNFSIDFFDIWIKEIYINEIPKSNKFLKPENPMIKKFNYITIKFFYKVSLPIQKKLPLW